MTTDPLRGGSVEVVEIEAGAAPWWCYLLAGIAWLVYAFIVLSFDIATIWAIALFAGFLFAFAALTELVWAAITPVAAWVHLILGVVFAGGAVFSFGWPDATFAVLAAIVGWVLMFLGVFNVVVAIVHRGFQAWWLWLVIGIAEILIGFWAVGYEGRSIALLVIWVAAAAVAKGIIDLLLALEVKHLRER